MADVPMTCHYATHSCDTYHRLERDAKVAAELGQALLVRHEAYVAETEQDRRRILGAVDDLEQDKKTLERDNADLVEDNRALLDRLEGLNCALTESETQVKALEVTLQSTQEQLRRMTALAARTEFLEKQLAAFEAEQADLQEQLATSKADERTTALRARQAERTIASLQDEFDRIEREARAEKERHQDVVARMERRRAVERELETAAVRLRGAAATKAPGEKAGNEVVSHFVKDILQDNANLQLGIVELREMLHNSNEEVVRLRDQLLLHATEDEKQDGGLSPKLKTELGLDTPQGRELHVHHHFHEPARRENEAPRKSLPLQRRISRKKKNVSISSTYSTPSSASRFALQTPTSAATILSQTSVSIPTRSAPKRWSMQSHQTGMSAISSVPSSPSRRTSSIFDRVFSDAGYDSSRPTSPDLSDYGSPAFAPLNKPYFPSMAMRTRSDPMSTRISDEPHEHGLPVEDDLAQESAVANWELPQDGFVATDHGIIEEEEGEDLSATVTLPQVETLNSEDPDDIFVPRRTLRRAGSHESLISISGMDIHTLQSRPSQLINARMLSSAAIAAPSVSLTSSKPVATTVATAALGHVTRPGSGERSASASHSKDLLSSLAGSSKRETSVSQTPQASGLATIGRSVGGWVKGSWGFAPASAPATAAGQLAKAVAPAATDSSHAPPASRAPTRTRSTQQQSRLKAMKSTPALPTVSETGPISPQRKTSAANVRATDLFRPPGINQPGAIFGLGPALPAPSKTSVEPGKFDEEALRDGLMGGLARS